MVKQFATYTIRGLAQMVERTLSMREAADQCSRPPKERSFLPSVFAIWLSSTLMICEMCQCMSNWTCRRLRKLEEKVGGTTAMIIV